MASLALPGCGPPEPVSAHQAYEKFLRLKLPAGVSHFEGFTDGLRMGLWTRAYFTYRAPPAYFTQLQRHHAFHYASELNQALVAVDCGGAEFITDFSYWVEHPLLLADKRSFVAIFFPTVHYLVYDTKSELVEHFVGGMRD